MTRFIKNIFVAIYNLIPFKGQLFYIVKKIYSPPQSIYKHLHFKGVINISIDKQHSFRMQHYGYVLENEMFWAGINSGWESESIKLWMKLSERSKTIFDIGANTGIFSLVAKCVNPKAEVFALEPVERVYNKLERNIILNGYDIRCLNIAASDFDGSATIYDLKSEHLYSVTVNKNMNPASAEVVPVEIQVLTIDTIIENNLIKKIDLMKIDVETHEPQVLEGYKKYIQLHSPAILIEIVMDEIGAKVEKILKDCGCNYLYFNIDEVKGIRQMDRITKSDHYNYLLCSLEMAEELELVKSKNFVA